MNLVVTGSSSGIGRSLVERLLAQGHRVWGLARSDQSGFSKSHGDACRTSICDVSKWEEVERASAEAAAEWPWADGLVTCAGRHGEVGRAAEADPHRWTEAIRTNLDGTFHAFRAFYPLLRRCPRRAKIVCFSGGGATKARENFSAYGAAKTAVVRLVETIAAEERNTRLDINAVAPGAVFTRLTEEVLALGPDVAGGAEYASALKQKAGGGGSIDAAVGLVEWLLSPASDGISGRLLAAAWDPWATLGSHAAELAGTDVYTLRRILPEERGLKI